MAAKNIHKIKSLNLFGLAKRLPKGKPDNRMNYTTIPAREHPLRELECCPQRHITPCAHLKNPPAEVKADFSRFMSKSSATSLIREERNQRDAHNAGKRFESQYAAEQVRKCNEILKDHFYQKRQVQQSLAKGTATNALPTLSQKLLDIMSLDVANTVVVGQLQRLQRFLGHERAMNCNDYKPQNTGYLNRWQMKLPPVKHNEVVERRLCPEDKAVVSNRQREANKDIKPPGNVLSNESTDKRIDPVQKVPKLKGMWKIGGRIFPRLD